MATLQTQYKNYLKNNTDSNLTYDQWLDQLSKNLAEVVLQHHPYISDDFQIGPDGAYEHQDTTNFRKTLKSISDHLNLVKYSNGDLSDIGNEIGIAVGNIFTNMSQDQISQFISGFKHGVSLTNGTH